MSQPTPKHDASPILLAGGTGTVGREVVKGLIEAIISSAALAQKGKYEVPDELIQAKLGRRARSLESWVAANRAAFTGALAS